MLGTLAKIRESYLKIQLIHYYNILLYIFVELMDYFAVIDRTS